MKSRRPVLIKSGFATLAVGIVFASLFYLSAAINAPNSGENYGFFLQQTVCANGSSPLCRSTNEGIYEIPEVIERWGCAGKYSTKIECNAKSTDKWIAASTFEDSRMGRLVYKLNSFAFKDDLAVGLQKLMLINALFASLVICATFFLVPKKSKAAFIVAMTSAALIPENLFHIASIAPIGITKVCVISALVISYELINDRVDSEKVIVSYIYLVFLSINIGIRRIDQMAILGLAVGGLALFPLYRSIRNHGLSKIKSKFLVEVFRVFGVIATSIPGVYLTLQNDEGGKTVAGLAGVVSGGAGVVSGGAGVVSGGAGVVSGGAGVVSGGAGVVSGLLRNIYEVAVLPGYFIQDIGPDFWGLHNIARYSLSVPTALLFVILIAKTWRPVMEHKSTLISVMSILGIYFALAWYGTVIGPRLEFRYVMGMYVFCIYAFVSCISSSRTKRLLFNNLILGLVLLVHTIGLIAHVDFSGSIYLLGSAYPAVFVSGTFLVTLVATVLILNSNYSKQVLNNVKIGTLQESTTVKN
jgi:hypothetical protein